MIKSEWDFEGDARSCIAQTRVGLLFSCRRCGHNRTYETRAGVMTAAVNHYLIRHKTKVTLEVKNAEQ